MRVLMRIFHSIFSGLFYFLIYALCIEAIAAKQLANGAENISQAKNDRGVQRTYNRRVLLTIFFNEQHDSQKDYLSVSIPDSFAPPLKKTRKFAILDRSTADLYLRVMAISQADLMKDENAVRLGKAMGADVVVVGRFASEGNLVFIEAKAIDVHAEIVSVQDSVEIKTNSTMFQEINRLAARMSGPMAEKLQPLQAPPPPPEISLEEVKKVQVPEAPAREKAVEPAASNTWVGNLWSKRQYIRVAGSMPYLMRTGNSELHRYYGNGFGAFLEYQWYNISAGGSYKLFWITDQSDLIQTARMQFYSFDAGYTYVIPWTPEKFFGTWSFSFGVLARFAYIREIGADGLANNFMAVGGVGKIVIAYQFLKNPSWIPGAVFTDFRYGFTPMGINKANVDGIQLFMGIQWRIQ